jgi:flavorubredoxin
MEKTTKIIIAIASSLAIGLSAFLILKSRKKSGSKSNDSKVDKSKNFIIGDSQTPLIAKNSQKARKVGEEGNKANLWESGKGLSWLKDAVDQFPVTEDVNSIVINIGTNGGFAQNDNVEGLISSIKAKFPNAQLLAVKGSWGWGGNKDVTQQKVDAYYEKFKQLGVEIIPTAIGVTTNPHSNLPVYAQIGREIDSMIK